MTVRKGMEHCGGRVWRCVECRRYATADCDCCEPPWCACRGPAPWSPYRTEQTEPFAGLGGAYRLVRFERAGRAKIELYLIRRNEPEAFVSHVPIAAWRRRVCCTTCGAGPHEPCRATGRVGLLGNEMAGVHACRRQA